MKTKPILTGLASALVVSVVCALSVSQASEQTGEALQPEQGEATVTQSEPESETTVPESSVEKVGEVEAEATEASLTQLYSHEILGKSAVTLYVKDIPVVTFLGDSSKAKAAAGTKVAGDASIDETKDPMWRATTVAAKINQFQQSGANADLVRVIWDKKQKTYVIRVQDEQLLAINQETILPKTTKDVAEDALKITNLLRRQLGEDKALTDIPGRPKPKIAKAAKNKNAAVRYQLSGQASWYGGYFHGRKTASGERYNQNALTAAHKTLRFGTRVRVTNLNNGRSVVVRINDRGPFVRGRIIDMSRKGAQAIGLTGSGVAPVRVDVLK
ncbi:Endolytic peptidoglycan transglycosylase RlpA [Acaryochloris thomasi RCC1774]|uniref:Probable endolytic peptidoglycan transglycosylase RlpA n=1 Tax=Acaryochloris thomasi RCC1774 TaxID=1764569 RepID=A0A2W1JC06_9CYAN|nr:septal ring lytic transglycosylase RlpA family protein [Acaryochloris thomasi]PZD71560.1 Endolytic peptidoglycan transglycosylase RlpA [Acaryochloris thomasi RCC1774]